MKLSTSLFFKRLVAGAILLSMIVSPWALAVERGVSAGLRAGLGANVGSNMGSNLGAGFGLGANAGFGLGSNAGMGADMGVVFAEDKTPVEYVNTLIGPGTSSTIAGPTLPNGSIHPSPETRSCKNGGYTPGNPVVGFGQLYAQGTGGTQSFGNFLLAPMTGTIETSDANRTSAITGEMGTANYYTATLSKYGVKVEVTPTENAAVYRFTYPANDASSLFLDISRKIGGNSALNNGSITIDPVNNVITGGGRFQDNWNPTQWEMYFAMQFDKTPTELGVWSSTAGLQNGVYTDTTTATSKRLGAYLKFGTTANEIVNVKIAISFVSAAKAKEFLDAQIPAWDFEGVRDAGKNKWNAILNSVEFGEGVTEAQREKFYTALWHANVQPRNRISDHGEWDDYYTIWDSWKTVFPFQNLMRPDYVAANINSFISRYNKNKGSNQYGYMSDAFIQGKEFVCGQGGNDIENIIADAYIKNIPGVDWEAAYEAVYGESKTMRTTPYVNIGYQYSGAAKTAQNGMNYSSRLYPSSATMGFAQNDYSIGIMAQGLGKTEDAQFYLERSNSWKNLWDPDLTLDGVTGLAHNKNQNGTFAGTSGSPVGYNNDYYEASLWEGSYYPIWDIDGMISLMGGKGAFASRLAYDLSKGHIDYGNEPSFQTIWLLCTPQVKRPDIASQYIQQFLARFPQNGYPGDEDNGAMSTLYMFLTSGFFPFSTTNTYYLHGTRLPEITYHLGSGKDFTIKGVNASPTNIYVQSATLNGEPLNESWITYEQIIAGAELEFVMGNAPSRWGRDPVDPNKIPTDVTNLQATVSSTGGVTLTWSASEDEDGIYGYRVYRGTDEDFAPSTDNLVGTTGATTTYTESPGFGIFYYKVLAENNDGNMSRSSPCAHAAAVYSGTPPSKYAGSLMLSGCIGKVHDQAAAGEGATQAFDANDATKWSARVIAPGVPDMSESGKYPLGSMWLSVDLIDECEVTGWIVQNEQSSVLSEFYLQMQDSLGVWQDVRHITGNTHISNSDPFTETLPTSVTGRYFRLLIPVLGDNQTTDNARVREFHLFGTRLSGVAKKYSITVLPSVGVTASVSASKAEAEYNETITVDISDVPEGFMVKAPGISHENGEISATRETTGVPEGTVRYTFAMPPRRVTIEPVLGEVLPPPPAVTNLSADEASLRLGWVKLTWDPSTHQNGIALYRVYRGKSADFVAAPESLVGETANASYIDVPDLEGYYFYKIVAVSGDGSVSEPSGCFYAKSGLPSNAVYGATPSTNVALNKTATANGYAAAINTTNWEYPSYTVDGLMSTKWSCRRSGTPNQGDNTDEFGNFWLQLDLGAPYVIDRWVVKHAHAGGEGVTLNTSDFALQALCDGKWVDVDPVIGNSDDITDRSVAPFCAQIVRLYVTKPEQGGAGVGNPRIYEFELYSPVAKATLTGAYVGSLTAFKPGWVHDQAAVGEGAAQAVDCNDTTKWSARVVFQNGSGTPDMTESDKFPLGTMWLEVDLGAVYSVGSYYISNEGSSNLRDFYIQARDPLGGWIDAVHDTTEHNGTVSFRADFSEPVAGRYFRLLLPVLGANQTTDNARIREFHLFPASDTAKAVNLSAIGSTVASVTADKTSALPGETIMIDVSGIEFGKCVTDVSVTHHEREVEITEITAGVPEGARRFSFAMPPCPVDAVVSIGADPENISVDARVVIIPVKQTPPVGKFSHEFSFTASQAMSVQVIAAAYSAAGALLSVEIRIAELEPFETIVVGSELDKTESATYKCFIWDGKTFAPLCQAVTSD